MSKKDKKLAAQLKDAMFGLRYGVPKFDFAKMEIIYREQEAKNTLVAEAEKLAQRGFNNE